MHNHVFLRLSRNQRVTLEKLLLRKFPNFGELFRWDVMDKEFRTLLGEKIGVMNRKIDHKGRTK